MQRSIGFALFLAVWLTSCADLRVEIPEYEPAGEIVRLDQGWTARQWLEFHHTSQGTRLVPYAWFTALEQPCLSVFACDSFSDPTYLSRFGFLESPKDPQLNPDGLPVGFARQEDFTDPETGESYPVVGLTCAACHTGELRYGDYAVRIEGGPAMVEVGQFQKALGLAMGLTQRVPGRFGRFAERVLGENASDEDHDKLRERFDAVLAAGLAERDAADAKHIYDNPAGFARTDALTRIGNQVFAIDMKNDENLAPANAAVRFPQIWDSSWLTWVQYNSSIADPLVRNIGEALGVRAVAKLHGPKAVEFDNSVNVEGLKRLEDLLAGDAPFGGLTSPKWPENVFPGLDDTKVARGAALYKEHCEKCHLPPIEELKVDLASEEPQYWWKNSRGVPLLAIRDIKVDFVGTDPRQAMDFVERTADTGDLGKGRVSAAEGLRLVTEEIALKFFKARGIGPEEQPGWRGNRDPNDPVVRAEAIYKARPLNGIWAVAPYLHNGSVPDLYSLLSPDERPQTFWLGSKRFDPERVGYAISELPGGYLYDTSVVGNSNKGHEFRDGPQGNGVIGPALSEDDRWALIEYLKSI